MPASEPSPTGRPVDEYRADKQSIPGPPAQEGQTIGQPDSGQPDSGQPTIGQRIREIRKTRNLTQRELADRVGINFTYLSRVENDRLDDEQTPREETLQRIARALETDADELLLLARRIPDAYRDRILSRPGVFRKLLNLSDGALEELLQAVDRQKSG